MYCCNGYNYVGRNVVYVVILLCNVCVSCKNCACVLSCKMDSNTLWLYIDYPLSLSYIYYRLLSYQETIEMWVTPTARTASLADMLKTTQPFLKSSYELHLTLWSIYLKVKIPQPKKFRSYLSQVTYAPQWNLMLIDKYILLKPYIKETKCCIAVITV